MRHTRSVRWMVLTLPVLLAAAACAQQARSSSEAIEHAKTLQTPEQQADYLLSQARGFLSSKDYAEATKTAQYVVGNFQGKSAEAQSIIEQAGAQVARNAQEAAGEARKKLGL